MSTINERIKELRKALGLTQQEFSSRLGISRNTVATYEIGPSSPSDSALRLISTTWNVNPEWLKEGKGEMYLSSPMNSLEQYCKDNGLDREEATFLRDFVSLPASQRKAAIEFTLKVAEDIRKLREEEKPYTDTVYEKDPDRLTEYTESTTSDTSSGEKSA